MKSIIYHMNKKHQHYFSNTLLFVYNTVNNQGESIGILFASAASNYQLLDHSDHSCTSKFFNSAGETLWLKSVKK